MQIWTTVKTVQLLHIPYLDQGHFSSIIQLTYDFLATYTAILKVCTNVCIK